MLGMDFIKANREAVDQAIRDKGWFFPVPDEEVEMHQLISK